MITDCILGRNSTLLGNPLIMYCDKTTKQNHRIISRVFNIIQQELPKKVWYIWTRKSLPLPEGLYFSPAVNIKIWSNTDDIPRKSGIRAKLLPSLI